MHRALPIHDQRKKKMKYIYIYIYIKLIYNIILNPLLLKGPGPLGALGPLGPMGPGPGAAAPTPPAPPHPPTQPPFCDVLLVAAGLYLVTLANWLCCLVGARLARLPGLPGWLVCPVCPVSLARFAPGCFKLARVG